MTLYEALGCGISQLSPNTVWQVSGYIARCTEEEIEPELNHFMSIYRFKYCNGQIYTYKQKDCLMLVTCPSTNQGWHSEFTFLSGPDLKVVGVGTMFPGRRLRG